MLSFNLLVKSAILSLAPDTDVPSYELVSNDSSVVSLNFFNVSLSNLANSAATRSWMYFSVC